MPSMPQSSLNVLLLVLGFLMIGGVQKQDLGAQVLQDVVYLKDGSIIKGVIVEQIPGQSILIETADENRFRYLMEQIDRITKEPGGRAQNPQIGLQSQKSPGTAATLSLLIVGAGQGYNGEWGKAALFFGGAVLFGGAAVQAIDSDECYYEDDCSVAGGYALAWIATAVWSIVDAYQSAKVINRRLSGLGLELLPKPAVRAPANPLWGRGVLEVPVLRWTW